MRKNVAYLVVAKPPSSTHNMTPTLKKFFRDLSLTFKVHVRRSKVIYGYWLEELDPFLD